MRSEPSPSKTITRRSGRASASPSPSDEAPPMKPTHVTEGSSGARVGHAEGVEERLAVADHRMARLARVRVLLAREEPDHVERGHAPIDRDAPERVHRRVEPGVLNHEHGRLAAHPEAGGNCGRLVL